MVSIYGCKYDAIFKHIEINQGRTYVDYHNHNKWVIDFHIEVSYLFIYLVIMDHTSWQNAENSKYSFVFMMDFFLLMLMSDANSSAHIFC